MDKVERLAYLITREIEDRPVLERFTWSEYRELLKMIRDFCSERMKRKGNTK